jgi:hypothetical protein
VGVLQAVEPTRPNALNVSWGDQIVVGKGIAKLDTPEHIRQALRLWGEQGQVGTVYWRISSWIIQHYHQTRREKFEWYYKPLQEIEARCDPRQEAIRACHDLNMRIYAYLTVFDEGSPPSILYGDNAPFPWQSTFTIEHPEYLVCDRKGEKRQYGVMEYWYPEVRRYKIGQILAFLKTYDMDGVYICTRSHSRPADTADQFGFNAPVVAEYQKRYGVDIRRQEFDLQKWRDLRGEGRTLFFRELRAALSPLGKRISVGVPRLDVVGPPYGNMTLAWRDWVKEGLVDEIVIGVNSGNFHYPSMKGKDKERGYLASGDEGFGLRPLAEDVNKVYGPLCGEHHVSLFVVRNGPKPMAGTAGSMIGAMSLPGDQLSFSLPPNPALDLAGEGSTVDFWVKPRSLKDFPRLLSKYDHTQGDAGRGWEIMIGEQGKVVFRVAGPGFDHHLASTEGIKADEWSHVACGRDAKTGSLFIEINGTRASPVLVAKPPRKVGVPLVLGAYAGGGRRLQGELAGLRIWGQTLDFDQRGIPRAKPKSPLLVLAVVPHDGGVEIDVSRPVGLKPQVSGILSSRVTRGPKPYLAAMVFGK